jgi:hypothetical protein
MLANISIRAKIIAVVAFLLVAITGMGLLAVTNMRSLNASTVDIATNWMPSVRVLGELRAGVITYRNVVREHMLAETLDEKLAAEKTLATVVESNTKIRQTYEPLITSPEERALYAEWSRLWDEYKQGTQEVMALSRKAAGQIPHEAHVLNTQTVNKIGLQADEVLKKDIDLNNSGAEKATASAADNYSAALMFVAIILGAAVVAGVASGGSRRCRSQDRAWPPRRRHHPRIRIDDRRDRQHRLVGLVPARSFRRHAVGHRRALAGIGHHRLSRLGRSIGQCAVGGIRDRGDGLFHHRNQPPGAGIGADGRRCGGPGPHHDRSRQRAVESGHADR